VNANVLHNGSSECVEARVPCLRLRRHALNTRPNMSAQAWTWHPALAMTLLVLTLGAVARADSAREVLQQGNRLFGDSKYTDAINKYNEALVEQPQALEPKFNKGNGYYRMDDLGEAMDLYQEVAAGSKDMALVARAKYNLGNCLFQRGSKQRDSDLQKAVDDMKTSITYWRQVLDIDPKNEKAARNIEVARLTIKDILDQLKKQQEQQKQQEPQKQQQDQQNQQQQQNQPQSQNDPNQPQDPNQAQKKEAQARDPNQAKDQQQPEQRQGQQQKEQQEQRMAPDATAQEILDREQQQKKDREVLRRAQYQQVDKDW
jgi:Ca-activated chloride channel family protein